MIRRAVEADIGALVSMARRFHASSQYAEWDTFGSADTQEMIETVLSDDDSGAWVAVVNDEIVGSIGATVCKSPIGPARHRIERWWWVNPGRRGLGLNLYFEMDRWATEKGAEVRALVSPAKNKEAAALYERLGYEPVEIVWVKKPCP